MITETEYKEAIDAKAEAQKTIDAYHTEKRDNFADRMKTNPIFTEDELVYSAGVRCPCGHGIAHPKDCGMHHYWDCSAVLKGVSDPSIRHSDRLPFAFYEIKSEKQPSAYGNTTRGIVVPAKAPQGPTGDISVGLSPTCGV